VRVRRPSPRLPLTACVPVRPQVRPYFTKVVGLAVVVRFKYGVAVYLLGSPRLTMAFRENGMLAEVLAHEAKDRESM
jgi:hypothetical protein